MLDAVKDLGIQAVIAAVLGGIIAYLLGMVLPTVTTLQVIGPLIGGLLAVVLALLIAKETDLDALKFLNLVILLVMVSIVGTLIVTVFPAATLYILTLSGTLTWSNILWSLVYVGLAMYIYEKVV